MEHFLKSLYWICYNTASILWFGFLTLRRGILASWSGIEPTPPTLEDEGLTLDHLGSPKGHSWWDLRKFHVMMEVLENGEEAGSGPLEQTVFLAFPVAICPALPSTSSPIRPMQGLIIDFIQGMNHDWPVFIFTSDWSINRQETQFYQ